MRDPHERGRTIAAVPDPGPCGRAVSCFALSDMSADDDEDVDCGSCDGTGEGMQEGTYCGVCRGTGSVQSEPDDDDNGEQDDRNHD